MSSDWLRCPELEQLKDPFLVGGCRGEPAEGRQFGNAGLDDLLGQGGQVLQNAPEILDRVPVGR